MKKLFVAILLAATAACSTPTASDDLTDAQQTALYELQPTPTRAGFLRFTDDAIHNPHAARIFLDRLASGTESEAVRAALVDALPRTGGDYANEAFALMATERSPIVRAAYAHTARRAPSAQALAIVERGLADASPDVQAEAIRATATLANGATLAPALRRSLLSSDAAVRMEAARAIGILQIAAPSELNALALDASPDVRREATRALRRIQLAPASTK